MEMAEIIRRKRTELNLSQADLAAQVGVDRRQIRRYEAGQAQPALSVAKAIARALGISIDELAGEETHRVDLSGRWWACWQSWKDGAETINPHQVEMRQQGEVIQIVAVTRGTALEDGGYLWRGELRVWDNEVLMGWYVADEGAVRSKGTMYFVLHQHGIHLVGRWVGLSYDGPIVTGWGAIARTKEEVTALMDNLRQDGTKVVV
jgi:transcriptional regulator with XRE-family HTH domain